MDKNILTSWGMAKKKLQTAYSRKEKLEKLIKNLEDLKKKGSISEDKYSALEKEYGAFFKESENIIEESKKDLGRKIDKKNNELKMSKESLENSETRFKVGEIKHKDFQKFKNSATKQIERLEREIPILKELHNSESSSDLGGYLDVKIEGGKGLDGIMETVGISSDTLDKIKEFFTEVVSSPKKLVIGVIIILAVICLTVLPWNGLPGKYAEIKNENDVVDLRKDGTFTSQEYGVSLSGDYRVEGKKLIFEFDFLGVSFPTECTRVRNGFDCPDGTQYRKIKEKSSVRVKRNSPSATVKIFFEAFEKGEYSKVMDCVSSYVLMSEPLSVQDFNEQREEVNNEGGIKKIDITKEEIEGETAEVCWKIESGDGTIEEGCSYLIKEKGAWKISEL